mmetsp:Transcript_7850/g.18786  ORF Transcript_7850/g.18786 Transcript_7850/m.18786 type:complete len:332 (+) Transcript_7850:27-1022(+)
MPNKGASYYACSRALHALVNSPSRLAFSQAQSRVPKAAARSLRRAHLTSRLLELPRLQHQEGKELQPLPVRGLVDALQSEAHLRVLLQSHIRVELDQLKEVRLPPGDLRGLHVADPQGLHEILIPHRLVERELGGHHKRGEQTRLPVAHCQREARVVDRSLDVDDHRDDARIGQLQLAHDRLDVRLHRVADRGALGSVCAASRCQHELVQLQDDCLDDVAPVRISAGGVLALEHPQIAQRVGRLIAANLREAAAPSAPKAWECGVLQLRRSRLVAAHRGHGGAVRLSARKCRRLPQRADRPLLLARVGVDRAAPHMVAHRQMFSRRAAAFR